MDELNNLLVGISEYTANLQLPDPTLRDWYRDEQDRIFYLVQKSQELNKDVVHQFFLYLQEYPYIQGF